MIFGETEVKNWKELIWFNTCCDMQDSEGVSGEDECLMLYNRIYLHFQRLFESSWKIYLFSLNNLFIYLREREHKNTGITEGKREAVSPWSRGSNDPRTSGS